ncbi:hypothetical protein EV361DRAFT_782872, partial [Lentinula raphanica]
IHPEKKKLVATLSGTMSTREIARQTGISQRAVQRTLKNWRDTGDVVRNSDDIGRPRCLSNIDLAFLEGCIERCPDIYLEDLRISLLRALGTDVHATTISRGL